ncbi:MAG: 30S ribosomal protein S11 [Patescibacteria group bacterium]
MIKENNQNINNNAKQESEKDSEVKIEEQEKTQTVLVKGKKKKKKEPFLRGGRGQVHVSSSYNNTIVSISDLNGAVLTWASAGKCGFKGPKKATPYAAGVIVKSLIDKIKDLGIKEVDVFLKGVGTGREAVVRALGANGMQVISIKDVTPIPHGGCRAKKPRRM